MDEEQTTRFDISHEDLEETWYNVHTAYLHLERPFAHNVRFEKAYRAYRGHSAYTGALAKFKGVDVGLQPQ